MMQQLDSDGNEAIKVHPIGYIQSMHTDPRNTPIQPAFAEGCVGRAEILSEYGEGLRDIEGFSHVIVIYHFHLADAVSLTVKPFLEDHVHGVFATRHPHRPNRIGLSVLPLIRREENTLVLGDVDILDGTPILDIKPFVSKFDQRDHVRNGWITGINEEEARRRGRRRPK